MAPAKSCAFIALLLALAALLALPAASHSSLGWFGWRGKADTPKGEFVVDSGWSGTAADIARVRGGATFRSDEGRNIARNGRRPVVASAIVDSSKPWWIETSKAGKRDDLSSWSSKASKPAPGSTQYSSSLVDQTKPWWNEKPSSSRGSGGALSGKQSSASYAPWYTADHEVSSSSRYSPWLVLAAAAPAALLAGAAPELAARDRAHKPVAAPKAPRVAPKPQAAKKVPPPQPKAKPMSSKPKAQQPPPKVVKAAAAAKVAPPKGKAVAAVKKGAQVPKKGGRTQRRSPRLGVQAKATLRVLGVLAVAALGATALYELYQSNLLISSWPVPVLDPWQALSLAAWAGNMKVVFVGGRLDGRQSATSRGGAQRSVRFFNPAGWAFAVWAPIMLGEILYILYQSLPLADIRGSWWLADLSPWFTAAMLFQSLWCYAFRPWAQDSGNLWLPAVLLGATAAALGGGHRVLREAWSAGDMGLPQLLLVHFPLSLHFAWITCATLVNVNGYFASLRGLGDRVKSWAALASMVVAVVLGAVVTISRGDPLYAGVVAWALAAVADRKGWGRLQGSVDDSTLRVHALTAKSGSILSVVAAMVPMALWVVSLVTGESDREIYGW